MESCQVDSATLEVGGEFLPHVIGQGSVFSLQLREKRRVIPLDDLVEQRGLGLVALVAVWYINRRAHFRQRCWQRQVDVLFDGVSV
ncbi:MAG: hypothetical protein WDZ76_14735 [Pseudohongiellaceae bacterium]